MGRMVSPQISSGLSRSRSYTRTTDPARVFSTGTSKASAAPSEIARNVESNVARGMVSMPSPNNLTAAASLNAPGSPWKATRMELKFKSDIENIAHQNWILANYAPARRKRYNFRKTTSWRYTNHATQSPSTGPVRRILRKIYCPGARRGLPNDIGESAAIVEAA